MPLLKLFGTGSFRCFGAQGFFALLVLPAVFLVMGCADPTSPEFEVQAATPEWIQANLAGIFECEWESSLVITNGLLFTGAFVKGEIAHVTRFTETSGVIFVEMNESAFNWGEEPGGRQGYFTGFYFENLNASGFDGAEAWAETGNDFPTLAEAQTQFTLGNRMTYFASTSRFTRQ